MVAAVIVSSYNCRNGDLAPEKELNKDENGSSQDAGKVRDNLAGSERMLNVT